MLCNAGAAFQFHALLLSRLPLLATHPPPSPHPLPRSHEDLMLPLSASPSSEPHP